MGVDLLILLLNAVGDFLQGPDQRETTQLSYQLHQILFLSIQLNFKNIQAVELVFWQEIGVHVEGQL